MGKVIDFTERREDAPNNLIVSAPWEFRKAPWETPHFVQMLRSQSLTLERHRKDAHKMGQAKVWQIPPHFSLQGGMAYTVRGVYVYRGQEDKMRSVYFLAGLMDCMINQVNPILRTDLLRDIYKKVFSLREELKVNWYGPLDHVLLPIEEVFFSEAEYRSTIRRARSMKDLYETIRAGTDEMFDILSLEYVFYSPSFGG
jgi:hypothetical protein